MTSPTVQVFVSSTWLDLRPEREALAVVAQNMREVKFVGMEYFGSRDESTRRASLDELDRSHLYIGIFAGRYGSGITEDEYRRARERRLPCFIYFKQGLPTPSEQPEQDEGNLARLKAELRSQHTVTEFDTSDDLAAKVTADLHRWLFDNYLPTRPSVSALHQLPSPPRDFTGRRDELDELMRALEGGGVTISGLQGLGGVGKTALALKLAQLLTPRYPDAQFYRDLKGTSKTPLSTADAMAHVIRAYQPTMRLPEGEAELSALYRSVLHDRRALLLMDNASDRQQVEPLLPPESCVMLVTSRQRFALPGLFTRNLDTLPAADARGLLLKIAPRISEQAETIARLCGYLPLALRLAASALAERVDLGVEDYVRRLTSAQQRLKVLDEVEASLSLSYELLSAETQARCRVLVVFPDTFDSAAAAAVWGIEADAAHDALSGLVKYSLLEWNKATARYRLHDLVRLFADARLNHAEREKTHRLHALHYLGVHSEALSLYLQGWTAGKRGLALFDLEWPNLQAGQSWAEKHAEADDETAAICSDYTGIGIDLLLLRQHPRDLIRWLESSLAAARRLKARKPEGMHLGNLGVTYYVLGEARRSIEFFEQWLAISREVGDRHGEGKALSNLGLAFASLGEIQRAIEHYEQWLAIALEVGDRRGEGVALSNLGNAYADLGETRRAIELYEQALAIARETGDHLGEGNVLGNLGLAHHESGETQRAMEFYRQQLIITREIGDLRGEANGLWDMGLLLNDLGRRDEAIAHAEAALEIYERIESPFADRVLKQLREWRGQEGDASGVEG